MRNLFGRSLRTEPERLAIAGSAKGLAAFRHAVLCATIAWLPSTGQADALVPFEQVAPLDGASEMVLEMLGIELADHPDGLLLGNGDLLAPGQWSDRLPPTGSVIPGFGVQFDDGTVVTCGDIACLETSLSGPVLRISGIPLRDSFDEMLMAPIDPQRTFALEYEADRQIVYDALGILFPAEHNDMQVLRVVPDSPAARAGLQAGHEVRNTYVPNLARQARSGQPITLYWRPPGQTWQEEGGLLPKPGPLAVEEGLVVVDGDDSLPDLPVAFRYVTEERGLMALLLSRPEMAPLRERQLAALRVLEGWSWHHDARACLQPPLARIDIRTSFTITDRNLAGIETDRFTASSVDPLFVEAPFAPFVEAMAQSLSSPETAGPIERAAGYLVRDEGCASPAVQVLRREIAALVQ